MAQEEDMTKIQLVDGQGQLLTSDLGQFVQATHLGESKGDFQVIAIMGPQSSGKSTLLNHVFGTSFVMMDAMTGRSQTTKGIWLAKASKITDHTTFVMDLEGNDGRERGEDDTNFERQIALFALAVADVLIVNIWCHDIGREQASGKPLLKTIFQVNLKLFAPEPNRKRTVLLFVIRDKSKTPLPKLVEVLETDLNTMWAGISKPAAYQDSQLIDFFDVQYAGMSHYEEKNDDFMVDAAILRRRFSPDGDDSLVRQNEHLPGAAFALSVSSIWDTIRQQKDLNLPAHKVMVANVRCAEIARDQLAAFQEDQAWQGLAAEAAPPALGEPPVLVPAFNTRLTQLMDSCITGYEEDALYFDAAVRAEKLEELQVKLQAVVAPVVATQTQCLHAQQLETLQKDLTVGLLPKGGAGPVAFSEVSTGLRAAVVEKFKKLFNEHLRMERKGWDGKDALAAFETAADELITRVRSEMVQKALSAGLKQLSSQLTGPVVSLLDNCSSGLWPSLYSVTQETAATTQKNLLKELAGFSLSPAEQQQLQEQVSAAAQTRLENHVREAALTRLSRMKDKFTDMFTLDAQKAPRMWKPSDNIPVIASQARLAAAQLLAQLAVVRPARPAAARDAAQAPQQPDAVEQAILKMAQADVQEGNAAALSSRDFDGVVELASIASWPDVDESRVLVQPHEVRTTWRDFMSTSNAAIQQALQAQINNKLANNKRPPLWAIVMMIVLGWNEAMALLWSPFYLLLGACMFFFGWSVYAELDVDTELKNGPLPAAVAIAGKLVPAAKSVTQRTIEAVQSFMHNPGEGVKHLVQELQLPNLDTPASSRAQQGDGSGSRYAVQGASIDGVGSDVLLGGSSASAGVSAAGLSKRANAAAAAAGVDE